MSDFRKLVLDDKYAGLNSRTLARRLGVAVSLIIRIRDGARLDADRGDSLLGSGRELLPPRNPEGKCQHCGTGCPEHVSYCSARCRSRASYARQKVA